MKELHNPTVLVIRHGATAFNRGSDDLSRLKGTTYDLPLTDRGHREAEKAGQIVSQFPIASLRHSGLLRSKETADHIEKATGLKSQEDDGLDPWDVGYLAGQTRDAARRRIEYYIRNPHKEVPEGQSYGDFFSSYSGTLARELKDAERNPGKARAVITHSCNVAATPSVISGDEPQFHSETLESPGGVTKLQKVGGHWRMSEVEA